MVLGGAPMVFILPYHKFGFFPFITFNELIFINKLSCAAVSVKSNVFFLFICIKFTEYDDKWM